MANETSTETFELTDNSLFEWPSSQRAVPAELRIRLVKLLSDGYGNRHLLGIQAHEDGGSVMKKIRKVAGASAYMVWLHRLVGDKQALFEGIITAQSHRDLEAQGAISFVDMETLKFLPCHTYLYHRPGDSCNGFLKDNARFCTLVNDGFGGQIALIMSWKTDKVAVIVLAIVATLLSVAAGTLFGIVLNNADLGIAITSGIATILGFGAFVGAKVLKR
ncbi:hypothetical protein LTR44_006007 [Exophiala sp. CCFEE 6388]|nr:hypothetical protein LTR44_006007 [Eurotiomycetes sp. CCFEE 6388]